MTVPTPSSPDPDHSRRSRPASHRRGAAGEGSGPYGASQPGRHAANPYPAHPSDRDTEDPMGVRVRREARDAALCALAVAVLGLGLGPMWVWLAPRVHMFAVDNGVYLKNPEGEEAVGVDGTFLLLALGFGAVTGALVFLYSRRGGVGLAVGLAAGALLGSVVAWRFGVWLGPETDLVAAAKAAGEGKTFEGPLRLQAKGALLAWSLAAAVVHLALVGVFGRPEPVTLYFPPYGDKGAPRGW